MKKISRVLLLIILSTSLTKATVVTLSGTPTNYQFVNLNNGSAISAGTPVQIGYFNGSVSSGNFVEYASYSVLTIGGIFEGRWGGDQTITDGSSYNGQTIYGIINDAAFTAPGWTFPIDDNSGTEPSIAIDAATINDIVALNSNVETALVTNNGVLEIQIGIIPEPGTAILGLLSLVLFIRRKR